MSIIENASTSTITFSNSTILLNQVPKYTNYHKIVDYRKHNSITRGREYLIELAKCVRSSSHLFPNNIPKPKLIPNQNKENRSFSCGPAPPVSTMIDAMQVTNECNQYPLGINTHTSFTKPKSIIASTCINRQSCNNLLRQRKENKSFLLNFSSKHNMVSKIISSTFLKIQRGNEELALRESIEMKKKSINHQLMSCSGFLNHSVASEYGTHLRKPNHNIKMVSRETSDLNTQQEEYKQKSSTKHKPKVALYTHVLNPYMLPSYNIHDNVSASTLGILKAMQENSSKIKRGFKFK